MNTIDKSVPSDVCDLIQRLLVQNPTNRLGSNRNFKALKSHPFFKGINFDSLHTQVPTLKSGFSNSLPKALALSKLNDDEPEIQHINFDFQIELEDLSKDNISSISQVIVYEEIVKKRSPWFHFNKRRLILLNDRLEYYDTITGTKKGDITLSTKCTAILKDIYSFEIFTPKRTFIFKVDSGRADIWCENINSVIEILKM